MTYIICVDGVNREATPEEIAQFEDDKIQYSQQMVKIKREDRNARLAECDWTQFNDTPLSNPNKLAWAEYRQALRDLPKQDGFPLDIVWPQQPK
jgi:hypothetical protein